MRRSHGGFLLFIVLIAVVIFGWYRGWFTVNKEIIKNDEQQAIEKLKEGAEKLKEGLKKDSK